MREPLTLVVDDGDLARVAPREIRVSHLGDAVHVAGCMRPQVVLVGQLRADMPAAVMALKDASPESAIVVLADLYRHGEALDCVAAGADFYGARERLPELRPVILAALRVAMRRRRQRRTHH